MIRKQSRQTADYTIEYVPTQHHNIEFPLIFSYAGLDVQLSH